MHSGWWPKKVWCTPMEKRKHAIAQKCASPRENGPVSRASQDASGSQETVLALEEGATGIKMTKRPPGLAVTAQDDLQPQHLTGWRVAATIERDSLSVRPLGRLVSTFFPLSCLSQTFLDRVFNMKAVVHRHVTCSRLHSRLQFPLFLNPQPTSFLVAIHHLHGIKQQLRSAVESHTL